MSRALRRAAKLSVGVTCLPAGEINDHFSPPSPNREQQLNTITETEFRRMCCDWVTVDQNRPCLAGGCTSASRFDPRWKRELEITQALIRIKISGATHGARARS